jgi:hypothetical protein
LVPISRPCKHCIIILGALFLSVPFSHLCHSEIVVPTHNIPKMITFEKKNSVSNVMFLEHTVAPGHNQVRNESSMMFLELRVALSWVC